MNQLIQKILLFSVVIFLCNCSSKLKDSYSTSSASGSKKFKFRDSYGSSGRRPKSGKKRKDSYGSPASGKTVKFKWRDSYSGGGKKVKIKKHRDSYGSKSSNKFKPVKWRDSFSSGASSPSKNVFKWRDSYSSGSGKKFKMTGRDSYGSRRKTKRRGYKDPNRKWWKIFGKRKRQGRGFKTRKAYSAPRKRKKIKKKKVEKRTHFEGL